MDFSDDYSPICDLRDKVSREIAFPFLEFLFSLMISNFKKFIFARKNRFFRKWKMETVVHSNVQIKQVRDYCFIVSFKARLGHKSLLSLASSQLNRAFTQVLLVASSENLKNTLDLIEIKAKESEVETLKIQNKKDGEKLDSLKKKLASSSEASECLFNEIRLLKQENSQLQDKLLTYEIHFGTYIRENEDLLRSHRFNIY